MTIRYTYVKTSYDVCDFFQSFLTPQKNVINKKNRTETLRAYGFI